MSNYQKCVKLAREYFGLTYKEAREYTKGLNKAEKQAFINNVDNYYKIQSKIEFKD